MFKNREEEMGVIVGGIVARKGLQFDTKYRPLNSTIKSYFRLVGVVEFLVWFIDNMTMAMISVQVQ